MGTLLAEIIIPKMFDSVQIPIGEIKSPYAEDNTYAHYCSHCSQVYVARWGYSTHMGGQKWLGDGYRCPHCAKHVSNFKGHVREVGGSAPINMKLRLYEYKETVALRIQYDSVRFSVKGTEAQFANHRESIVFDVQKRKSFFKDHDGLFHDISNPMDNSMPELSALAFLKHNCLAWSSNKKDFSQLLYKIRETVNKKAKTMNGKAMKAMFVPVGSNLGALIFPMQNVAWRLAVPDAPNIDAILNALSARRGPGLRNILEEFNFRACSDVTEFFDKVLISVRKGQSYPQSVLKAADMPDTKAFRKILAKGPIFEIGRLHTAYLLSEHYQEQLAVYEFLATPREEPSYSWRSTCLVFRKLSDVAVTFLKQVSSIYGEGAVYSFLTAIGSNFLYDSARTYNNLDAAGIRAFETEKPALRKIHDWLVFKWEEQKNKDFSLAVPEHVVKRLAMQKDRLKFFLPETAHELKSIGQKMHNCVGTYADRVLAGRCAIVAMTDDEGKLLVCIEVTDGAIRQAKLNQNRPVSANPELNAAVLDWAQKAKLKIATTDIAPAKKDNKELRNAI